MSLIRVKAFHYEGKEMKALDDNRIVDLYLSRDETAIAHTSEKYGSRLRNVAYGIVEDLHTAEECVCISGPHYPPHRTGFLQGA